MRPDYDKNAHLHALLLMIFALSLFGCVGEALPSVPSAPATYSLAAYQTPIRDQGERASCWAFASVAALEAAYNRKYKLQLDLSEQYAFHVLKAGELYGNYLTSEFAHENNSSTWGHQGNSDALLNMKRFALPSETAAPYESQFLLSLFMKWTPEADRLSDFKSSTQEQLDTFEFSEQHIPTEARYETLYQVKDAENLIDYSPESIENIISQNHEVVADFNLQWKLDIGKGAMDWDAEGTSAGTHAMLVVAYDRNQQIFWLKNSWGGEKLLQVTYKYVRNAIGSATYITDVQPPKFQAAATWLGRWKAAVPGHDGELLIRRFTDFRNSDALSPTKLGNFYERGQSFDVEGQIEDDGNTLAFTIASTTARVQPGLMTGTVYRVQFNSNDHEHASGDSAQLTRDRVFVRPSW